MIRKLKNNDVEDLLEIWYAASSLAHPFLNSAFMEKEKKNIREIYIPNTETWMYDKDGINLGFISMIKNEVGAIFVRPEMHGQKIGFELMNYVADLYKELEVEVFEQNKIGRAFYDRYGFTFLHKYVHDETGDVVLRMKYSQPIFAK